MPKKIIEPLNVDFGKLANAIVASSLPEGAQTSDLGPSQTDFLFYNSGEGGAQIRVFVSGEDVWVTQKGMSEIFGTTRANVTTHLSNIFKDGELDENSVCKESLHTAEDGKNYKTKRYNLDAILSVGYRVNSRKAVQFRKWASSILREYLIKGFAMDDERLKNGEQMFGKDYFDELLERIRDIRASERRFYQKVTDIYIQCSHDYDPQSDLTQKFFAHAQNKLEYAVTGMTAAEIIKLRADHKLPNMGLTTWKNQSSGGKIRKSDTSVAKNYLAEDEISDLNRLVSMFLDYADNFARKRRPMSMKDWHEKLDDFLKFNEYQILSNYGRIKKKTADKMAELEFSKFKPVQDAAYKSDFDKVVEHIQTKGNLPSS